MSSGYAGAGLHFGEELLPHFNAIVADASLLNINYDITDTQELPRLEIFCLALSESCE